MCVCVFHLSETFILTGCICSAVLKTVIEIHGEGVVESLVPIFVWVLEGLANCKSQLRDREEEANREKAEKEDLLERYQTEKTQRKESQEVSMF